MARQQALHTPPRELDTVRQPHSGAPGAGTRPCPAQRREHEDARMEKRLSAGLGLEPRKPAAVGVRGQCTPPLDAYPQGRRMVVLLPDI